MRGGYRAGAGRKKDFAAKNAEEVRRILSEMVMQEIVPIGKALITKAKKGDVIATRELFDRAFGKAAQNVKIDPSERGLPAPIMGIFASREALQRFKLTDNERDLRDALEPKKSRESLRRLDSLQV